LDDTRLRMLELSGKGYYCSQVLLALALEAQGKEDPDLIRAMAGLAKGIGEGPGTCGTLTGAACMLALYTGKGQDGEAENPDLWPMLFELWEWFEGEVGSRYGGVTCNDILSDGSSQRQRCGPIVEATYFKTLEILTQYGVDPTEPRESHRG
jgi:C_GCAxxG_C_C family probable redox protein